MVSTQVSAPDAVQPVDFRRVRATADKTRVITIIAIQIGAS